MFPVLIVYLCFHVSINISCLFVFPTFPRLPSGNKGTTQQKWIQTQLNVIYEPGLTQEAQGNMGCFWPTPRCWRVAWQPVHRCYQSPWRYPDRPVGCTGDHTDCWDKARLAAAGKWALTPADPRRFLHCCCCYRTRHQGRWRHLWAWWRGWGSAEVGCDRVELL